ncbi:2OG-Fe(II) oxygenase [Microbulbifer taiwanensis]|uniref:2OG-Fe(II) oxygenase n=1 Tax=Microbulbifer taiwanensis TaxID=986746 RepID=A0ABW1YGU3_9GAMM|nr:2OG-Fe(II) oxygenase [Microbulbifer taiwanensis]
MEFEQLEPDLQEWIRDAVRRGLQAQAIVDTLLSAGYPQRVSDAVDQYFLGRQGESRAAPPLRCSLSRWQASTLSTSDREVQILLQLRKPRVALFGNLLSERECDELIALSRPRIKPSRVVNRDSGSRDIHPQRTSSGAYFRCGATSLIQRIERRISDLLSVPVSRGEGLQVLNYLPGAEYKPHYDYFDPDSPGFEKVLKKGGQRFATLIIYLNDVQAGGSTTFPEVGLDILPRKGHGLFFSYCDAAGNLDELTLHGGSPVVAGEKWIATKWLRLGDYTG